MQHVCSSLDYARYTRAIYYRPRCNLCVVFSVYYNKYQLLPTDYATQDLFITRTLLSVGPRPVCSAVSRTWATREKQSMVVVSIYLSRALTRDRSP